ncbi:MAG: crotonase/enoyl-CoA hydratase family protein [Rhodoblastus sp.]|nr:crotonase/enoyl-CoA hydratase family protein [Rhodoblastus sp.]MCC0000434.1 crotonase/enoyl-CoA hydratase family protein [Methylobacteriaceae bacterium]MCO5085461.1 crotonase/enoyl-CoA hydratase family protein [Methylobacteriaceae bacterium]HPG01794.1 crotonase/enoyl-CoA hydratase family protein [Rhodoblastus sp.]
MAYETIRVSVEDHVQTITLHRPDKLNAFTRQMMDEMIAAFDEADANDDVRVVIVTGEGRAFCAGADLSAGASTFELSARKDRAQPKESADGKTNYSDEAIRDGGGRVTLRIFKSLKPVIGAINGPAVGIGATMTLPMDIRLASTEARIGFVFSRRGIVMEAASSWFLPRLVGPQQALEWVYSGRVFNADEALRGGLVRSVLPPDQLLPEARKLAKEIVDNTSPVSVALMRQMVWRMLGADDPMEAHKIDSRGIFERGRSADVKEGVMSFLEKRPAKFPDKVSKDMPPYFPWWDERGYK